MSKKTKVFCPICERTIPLVVGAVNAAGEAVMGYHLNMNGLFCKGSTRSPRVAVEIAKGAER